MNALGYKPVKNIYSVAGNLCWISIFSPTYGWFDTCISKNMINKAKQHQWIVDKGVGRTRFYVMTNMPAADGKYRKVRLHAFLMDTYITKGKKMVVDHLDENPFNNCTSNLEVVTNGENQRRSRLRARNRWEDYGFKNQK
jgi:hypothetical protein